jgi:hypothetical protein
VSRLLRSAVGDFLQGRIIVSLRLPFLFGLVCLAAAVPALSTGCAAPTPTLATSDFPQFVTVAGCDLITRDKLIVLKGPVWGARVLTTNKYKPRFAVHVNAKTDSKNLRLYYNVGVLIFNWETKEDELRIHDPATGEETGIADQGKIEPDKYHDIVWELYPDGMGVLVDGNERARKLGEYEKLDAPLGIGPAFGSVITMTSFRVEELKGKPPQ